MTWYRKLLFVAGLTILFVGGVCNLQGVFGPKVDWLALVSIPPFMFTISELYYSMERRGLENSAYLPLRVAGVVVLLLLIPVAFCLWDEWWLMLVAWIGTVMGLLASFPLLKPRGSA